jgi:hypothetical protein
MASVVVQIPASMLLVDLQQVTKETDHTLLFAFLLNGLFFHFQSITAYVLMDYISPVTHRYALCLTSNPTVIVEVYNDCILHLQIVYIFNPLAPRGTVPEMNFF